MMSNKSFDADTHVLACVPHARLMCAGQVRRYTAYATPW